MTARALKLASPAPPCVGYVRVSTEEQATPDKPSLAQQRDAVLGLAQRLKVTVGDVFEDAGKSGGTFEKRPAWQRLVSYCEAHPQPTSRAGHVLIDRDDPIGPAAERRMVGYMFERYDSGDVSLGMLKVELKAKWPGLANWSRPVVRQMLRNPAYYGDVIWHDGRGGPVQTHVPNAHPALIKRVL